MKLGGSTSQFKDPQPDQPIASSAIFTYKGRLRRRGFALRMLVCIAIWIAVFIFAAMSLGASVGTGRDSLDFLLALPGIDLIGLLISVFIYFQTAQRLHDIGWSGWFCFLPYIQIPLLFIEGEPGENQYGLPTKQRGPAPSDEDLVNSPSVLFARPFSFRGRIRRLEYFLSCLIQAVSIAGLVALCVALYDSSGAGAFSFIAACGASVLLLVPIVWFGLAQEAKRLHDVGLSGWFALVPIFTFTLFFVPSRGGTNRWGSCPKAGAGAIPPAWEVDTSSESGARMFRNPFSFKGRIRRTEYGLSLVILAIVALVWQMVLVAFSIGYAGNAIKTIRFAAFLILLLVPMLWFGLAQTVKRLHDIDVPGLFCFTFGITLPLVFTEGTKGPNQYGPSPKVIQNSVAPHQ